MLWSETSIARHRTVARLQRTRNKLAVPAPYKPLRTLYPWEQYISKRPDVTAGRVVNRLGRTAMYMCDTGCRHMIDGVGLVCNRPCACVLCPWCCADTSHCPGAKWTRLIFPRARQTLPRVLVDPVLAPPATKAAMAAFPGAMHIQIQSAIRFNARLQHRAAEFRVDPKAYATVIEEQPPDAADYLALLHIAPRMHTVVLTPTLLDVYCAGLFRRRRVRNERITCGLSMLNAETGQSGVSIGKVDHGSSAANCGLIPGCVLTAVNGIDIRGYTSNAASRAIFREIEKPCGCWDEWSIRTHCKKSVHRLQIPACTKKIVVPTVPRSSQSSGSVWFRRTGIAVTYFIATLPNRMARIEPRMARWPAVSLLRRAWELIESGSLEETAAAIVLDARKKELTETLDAVIKNKGRLKRHGHSYRASGMVSERVSVSFYVDKKDVELARLVEISPAIAHDGSDEITVAVMEAVRGASYVVIDSFDDARTASDVFCAMNCLQKETL